MQTDFRQRRYQLVPKPIQVASASPPGASLAPLNSPDQRIEQVVRVSEHAAVVKIGPSLFTWAAQTGQYRLLRRFKNKQGDFSLIARAEEGAGHTRIFVVWRRFTLKPTVWKQYATLRVGAGRIPLHEQAEHNLRLIRSECQSSAILAHDRVVSVVGKKLKAWNPIESKIHQKKVRIAWPKQVESDLLDGRIGSPRNGQGHRKDFAPSFLNGQNAIALPIGRDSFALWMQSRESVGDSRLYILQMHAGQGDVFDASIANVTFKLPQVNQVHKVVLWRAHPQDAPGFGLLALDTDQGMVVFDYPSKVEPEWWGHLLPSQSIPIGRHLCNFGIHHCFRIPGKQAMTIAALTPRSMENPRLFQPASLRDHKRYLSGDSLAIQQPAQHIGLIRLLQPVGFEHPCLLSNHTLAALTSSEKDLRLWQYWTPAFRPIDSLPPWQDMPLLAMPEYPDLGIFTRNGDNLYGIHNDRLIKFIKNLVSHRVILQRITNRKELSGSRDEFGEAEEFANRINSLLNGRHWASLVHAKHDVLALMFELEEEWMHISFYIHLLNDTSSLTPATLQLLFMHTSRMSCLRFPFTLASVAAREFAIDSVEHKQFSEVVYRALSMSARRHLPSARSSLPEEERKKELERLQRYFRRFTEAAVKQDLISAEDKEQLDSELLVERVMKDSRFCRLQDQVERLQNAAIISQRNIQALFASLNSLRAGMVKKAKRNFFFGLAKVALGYFGGRLVEMLQNVVDLSDMVEIAKCILPAELPKPIEDHLANELQDMIADRLLEEMGVHAPDADIQAWAEAPDEGEQPVKIRSSSDPQQWLTPPSSSSRTSSRSRRSRSVSSRSSVVQSGRWSDQQGSLSAFGQWIVHNAELGAYWPEFSRRSSRIEIAVHNRHKKYDSRVTNALKVVQELVAYHCAHHKLEGVEFVFREGELVIKIRGTRTNASIRHFFERIGLHNVLAADKEEETGRSRAKSPRRGRSSGRSHKGRSRSPRYRG